jgi:hypothetical protein
LRKHLRRSLVCAACVVALPRLAAAQQVATSFDELTSRVRAGETLIVTDTRGATVKGKLLRLAGSSLDMTIGRNSSTPPLSIPAADINNIVTRRADRLWDGPLIGLAVGVGSGLVIEFATQNEYQKFQGGGLVGLGVFSMATGLVIDLFNRPKTLVYVRPRLNP